MATVKTRMLVKADSAPFLNFADLAVRLMTRVEGNRYQTGGANPKTIEDYRVDHVKVLGKTNIAVGHIGYIAGNAKGEYLEVKPGASVKVIAVDDSGDYLDLLDSDGKEFSGVNINLFIPIKYAIQAGYPDINPKEFEFNINKFNKPLTELLHRYTKGEIHVTPLALDASGKYLIVKIGQYLSVYNADKRNLSVSIGKFTGLFKDQQTLLEITQLVVA